MFTISKKYILPLIILAAIAILLFTSAIKETNDYMASQIPKGIPLEVLEPEREPELVSLGEFRISHYCSCVKCCGKSNGITATGAQATEGKTIAVDPDIIPLGTDILIDGVTYTAEDVGGAIKGNKLDVFVDSHDRALELGIQNKEVFVYER